MTPVESTKKSNIKRLPEHSHTIIFKFESKKARELCVNSEDFKELYAEMAKILINYNCRIEIIKWDYISGKVEN
ncbi:MAG: hypothetical protein ACTSR8_14270 [Promethearchaeota archaeon]